MLRRQSPPHAAASSWNMGSFLYRQLERRAAYEETIPLGERKIPDYHACARTHFGNDSLEGILCENN